MDANAVYMAWGKPSRVFNQPSGTGAGEDETWIYYGNRPVLTPRWSYVPDRYGYGTLQYYPGHYSQTYVKAEVHFHNGRVADWKSY
jgi:hypothetical protein